MKKIFCILSISLLGILSASRPAAAQGNHAAWGELQTILKDEGEVFIVVDTWNARLERNCTSENLFTNQVELGKATDQVKILYLNVTENFCDPYVLQTRITFSFKPQDLDVGKAILVQKNYDYGQGKLKEGEPKWFEIHLPAHQNKPLIEQHDLEAKEVRHVSKVSVLFKTQEAAKRALSLLKRSAVAATQ